ncbi:MAG TPA: proton-conducting transporter membrane subunit [Gaiellaceae bacterium]|nr:proton-conducting transporter membrane subunit [Gaiellaceae bacterium]
MTTVLAIGFALLAGAVPAARLSARVSALLASCACLLLAIVGFVTAGHWSSAHVNLGSWIGFGPSALVSDRLAGLFFALIGVTGASVSLACVQRPLRRYPAALHATLLLAVAVVVGADQGFLFFVGWETITLSLYLLASADREDPRNLIYAFFGGSLSKVGGAAILAAFALLYARTGSFEFAAWQHAQLGGLRDVVFVLLVVGFGTKIGLIPFQSPLPLLYAAAPGATSATISIAFNAALYALWRIVFGMLAPAPMWWGEALVVLGGLGALVGILYAVTQDEIKRFFGFSSVEHGGIVLLGFGVALIGQAAHQPKLAAAGLLAATLHLVMHGIGKTLAFLAADRVATETGQEVMGPLGGLAKLIPQTAVGFGVAVLTLAALPPLGGFVSEWFTLEALLQGFRLNSTIAQLIMALGGAMLALTAGIGLLAFARAFGGIFLGRARTVLPSLQVLRRLDIGVALLTVICLGLGAVAPWEIHLIGSGLQDLLGFDLSTTTISHPLVLGPVYPNFSVLSPTWLSVAIPVFLITAAVVVRVLLRPPVRTAPVWMSGTYAHTAAAQYTPEAYAHPIRVVLAGAYGLRRTVTAVEGEDGTRQVETHIVAAFEDLLYRPLGRFAVRTSAYVRRFQSGRLGQYLLYVLIVLLVVLALIPALRS